MLHTQLEQIAHWHFFVLRSYVASSPWTGCYSGRGSGRHRAPPSHTEALQTLQQLTLTGIMHKRLLEQRQRHNTCFPRTGHSNACNACPGITNQKCPSLKAQERWHLYVSRTNKQRKSLWPRTQGPRWTVLSFQDTVLRVSVSGILTRIYTISFQNTSFVRHTTFPFLCSSWENWLWLTKPPNNSLHLPPCHSRVTPYVAVQKRDFKCAAGSKWNTKRKCGPEEINFNTSLYGCVQCHWKFVSARYGHPLNEHTQRDGITILSLWTKILKFRHSGFEFFVCVLPVTELQRYWKKSNIEKFHMFRWCQHCNTCA